jgi:hypothetical protein
MLKFADDTLHAAKQTAPAQLLSKIEQRGLRQITPEDQS